MNEDGRYLGDDGVAEPPEEADLRGIFDGAAISQSEGNPINQAEKAGFNTPVFAISTEEKFGSSPGGGVQPCRLLRQAASSRLSMCPCWRRSRAFWGLRCRPPRLGGMALGVGHPTGTTRFTREGRSSSPAPLGLPFRNRPGGLPTPLKSVACGVGHPEEALADVGRALATSRQIGGCEAISQLFQVRTYSGEPDTSREAANLFAKDCCRSALGDEAVELGPEVSWVGVALFFARRRPGLAGTGAGPDGLVLGPSGQLQGERPAADTVEEVALSIVGDFFSLNCGNASAIDLS